MTRLARCQAALLTYLKTILLALCTVASVYPTLSQALTFTDDFNRPDSPTVGKGWSDTAGNVGGNLAIKNNELTCPSASSAGIFRLFPFTAPITVTATVKEQSDSGLGLSRRYVTRFRVRDNGTLNQGYGVLIGRADQFFNSQVILVDGDTQLDSLPSSFQYGPELHVSVTFNLDGSVTGTVTDPSDASNVFSFSFASRTIQSTGDNFSIETDCNPSGTVHPRIDDVSITQSFLSFPLHLNNEADGSPLDPDTVIINSVFDHQVPSVNGIPSFYKNDKDGVVTAYTGETGSQNCGPNNKKDPRCKCNDSVVGYKKDLNGTVFQINDYYTGGVCLFYEGHPGFDYRATMDPPTPIFAAADGIAFIPDSDPVTSGSAPEKAVDRFNVLAIDHGNGYSTWYLHLGNATTGEDLRLIKCPSDTAEFLITDVQNIQHQLPVTTRCQIGKVGDKGVKGSPHLHFEVRVGLTKDQNGSYQCNPGQCIPVDPYGWTDPDPTHHDPYIVPNVRLWK